MLACAPVLRIRTATAGSAVAQLAATRVASGTSGRGGGASTMRAFLTGAVGAAPARSPPEAATRATTAIAIAVRRDIRLRG